MGDGKADADGEGWHLTRESLGVPMVSKPRPGLCRSEGTRERRGTQSAVR